jgi:stage V sporulation protein B
MALSGWTGSWLFLHFPFQTGLAMKVLLVTLAISSLYLFMLLLLGLLHKEELNRIPWIGKPLAKLTFR